jgi:hypothetical protein
METKEIDNHRLKKCPKRLETCIHCSLSLEADKFEEHRVFCESRTNKCEKCDRFIKVIDQNGHDFSNCDYPKQVIKKKPAKLNFEELLTLQDIERLSLFDQPRASNSNSFNRRRESSVDKFLNLPQKQQQQNDDFTLLPCEFCNEIFPMEIIIFHQNECRSRSPIGSDIHGLINLPNDQLDNDQLKNDKIPCDFCRRLFSYETIAEHELMCDKYVEPTNKPSKPLATTDSTLKSSNHLKTKIKTENEIRPSYSSTSNSPLIISGLQNTTRSPINRQQQQQQQQPNRPAQSSLINQKTFLKK